MEDCVRHPGAFLKNDPRNLELKGKRGDRPFSYRFSGDTQSCEALIEVGQGADLLIHEASLGADMKKLAASKGHSTIDQAILVGLRSFFFWRHLMLAAKDH